MTSLEDDWSGITDPVRRRKIQNRLSQRTWRRRKTAARILEDSSTVTINDAEPQQHPEVQLQIVRASGSVNHGNAGCSLSPADQHRALVFFEEAAYQAYKLGSPRVELLLTLVRFNVFRALADNNHALGFSSEWMEGDAVSAFNNPSSGRSAEVATLPTHLKPTFLQHSIEHHPWIDLLPLPQMRDNILGLGETYDDAPLCKDIVEITDSPGDRAGLIVWGDPWSPQSWEVSEEFLKKWSWVIRDCWELCSATNHWRARRGEQKLFPDSLCLPSKI